MSIDKSSHRTLFLRSPCRGRRDGAVLVSVLEHVFLQSCLQAPSCFLCLVGWEEESACAHSRGEALECNSQCVLQQSCLSVTVHAACRLTKGVPLITPHAFVVIFNRTIILFGPCEMLGATPVALTCIEIWWTPSESSLNQ